MSKRKITIETRGPIPQKSGIVGPITVPYLEEVSLITRMIIGGIKITEHQENGEKVQLTSRDLKDLNAGTKVVTENRLQNAERTALQKLAQKEQDRLAAEREEKLEAAKAEIAAKNAPTEVPLEDEQPKRENLSKKERKEQARLAAEAAKANNQQEDVIETK